MPSRTLALAVAAGALTAAWLSGWWILDAKTAWIEYGRMEGEARRAD